MTGRSTVLVTLRLRIGAEPICGEIEAGAVQARLFRGWLELIEVLSRLVEPKTSPGPGDAPDRGIGQPDGNDTREGGRQ